MDKAFLETLGLSVREADGVVEADLELSSGQAINPLTRAHIESVSFTVVGDRLLYVSPAEFVGAQPINLAFISSSRLEDLVMQTLNDHLFQLERRSTELSTLGISPRVDPQTLQLTAELTRAPFVFLIGAARSGQFRLIRAIRDGAELTNTSNTFELSEFQSKTALEDFLFAMYSDIAGPVGHEPPAEGLPSTSDSSFGEAALSFRELYDAFGDALLPERSSLEVLADVRVGEKRYRFAAARVQGRLFRGLLAGDRGKVWADRFTLDEFVGIRPLISEILSVPLEQVEIVS